MKSALLYIDGSVKACFDQYAQWQSSALLVKASFDAPILGELKSVHTHWHISFNPDHSNKLSRFNMKFVDTLLKNATQDPEFLEGFSTMVLTGFMTLLVIIMFI